VSDLGSLAYWEWSAETGSDLDDEDALRQANPAWDTRVNHDFVREVERVLMDDEEFARERLGIVVIDLDENAGWEAIDEDAWNLRHDTDAPEDGWLTGPVTLSIEVTNDPKNPQSTIMVAGERAAGGVGFDVVQRERGTDWLIPALEEMCGDEAHPVGRIVLDPRSPAGALEGDLTAAGLPVSVIKNEELQDSTGWVLNGIREGGYWHRGDARLTESARMVVLKKYRDGHLVDRWALGDPTPFIGAVTACWGHLQGPTDKPAGFAMILGGS
jgi:hypothetical protein